MEAHLRSAGIIFQYVVAGVDVNSHPVAQSANASAIRSTEYKTRVNRKLPPLSSIWELDKGLNVTFQHQASVWRVRNP